MKQDVFLIHAKRIISIMAINNKTGFIIITNVNGLSCQNRHNNVIFLCELFNTNFF